MIKKTKTKIILLSIFLFLIPSISYSDYPNTSIGVIDLNKILAEADAAVMASEQIEEIAIEIEGEIKKAMKKL